MVITLTLTTQEDSSEDESESEDETTSSDDESEESTPEGTESEPNGNELPEEESPSVFGTESESENNPW